MTAPAIPGGPARYLRRVQDAGQGPGIPRDAPASQPPRRWAAPSWRWFLLAWLIALIVFAANDPGRIIFDTKLGVDIDASGFYARLWPLWNPLEWFGTLQDQYIGYAIPMGPFFLAGQLIHLPVWLIERLWLSLLVAAGFWGLAKLATALRIGSEGSRLLAAAAFVLWPTFTIVIGSTSAAALPGLMAPWAVLPLVTGLRGRRSVIVSCARSGLAVLLMGGVNAVSTISVLVLPGLYILTHTRGKRRVGVLVCWGTAVAAATAWWAIPLLLQGRYSFNFLPYVEQAATTTKTISAASFLRGAGNWTAYLNFGAPWLSAGWAIVSNPAAILASAAVAAGGLAGLARRDIPERLWLGLCVGVCALVLVGYPGPLGGPLHGTVGTLLNGALAPFRNVSKFEPVIAVALALGLAHVLGRVSLAALRRMSTVRRTTVAVIVAPVVAASLAGLALPYLTGQILQPGSFTRVPAYWSAVANFLAARSPNQTALVVPGDSHGIYLWGDTIDEPLEPLASSPWAERSLVPYGGAGSQVFLSTVENAIESGQDVPGLAAYLQRAGVRYVVVRNDLSPGQIGYISPRVALQTLSLSGFTRVAKFGPLITGSQTSPLAGQQVQAYLPKYPAVEVYQAASPAQRPSAPVAALPVSSTAFVNGGPDSLLQLDGQGILGSNQAAVIAGDATSGRPALWAVTDGQRRTDNSFGLINSNVSFTYTATGTNPADDALGGGGGPPRQILPVSAAGRQTVAVLSGAAKVTASSYGSWLTYQPQYDPVNAFDGNTATAWAEGSPTSPVGQWIQINFSHSLDLPASIGVQLLVDNFNRSVANQLRISTAAGQATTTLLPTSAVQQLRVRPGPTTWLRITIMGASNAVPGNPGAGISEVTIPGVTVTRYLQPAQSGEGSAAPSDAFSFHQAAPAPAGQADRAATVPLARQFTLSSPQELQLTGSAVAQPSAALQSMIARLTPPDKSGLLVRSTSVWGSLPEFGPDNLFTNTKTPWIAGSSNPTISLSWPGRRKISEIIVKPGFGFTAAPSKIKVTSPAGTQQATIGLGGVATLATPLTTNQLTISFPGWASAKQPGTGPGQPTLGLSKISIPTLSGLRVGGPPAGTRFRLPCGQGPAISLDGQTLRTAVSGTIGDLEQGLPVQVRLCSAGGSLSLASGGHRLLSQPGLFTMTDVSLRSAQSGTEQASAATRVTSARSLRVLSWQADSRSVRIGPGSQSYVEVHQNANPGWVATLNGRPLTRAVLDGWQQAFVVPAGAGGVITMTFAPATVYHVGLVLSALAILVLLALAALRPARPPDDDPPTAPIPAQRADLLPRRYLEARPGAPPGAPPDMRPDRFPNLPPGTPGPAAGQRTLSRNGAIGRAEQLRRYTAGRPASVRRYAVGRAGATAASASTTVRSAGTTVRWIGVVAVAGLIFLIGGPVVLAVPLLAVAAAIRPRWLPAISLAAMFAAGVAAAAAQAPAAVGSGAFGPNAQALALVALAAALYPHRWQPLADGHPQPHDHSESGGHPQPRPSVEEPGYPPQPGPRSEPGYPPPPGPASQPGYQPGPGSHPRYLPQPGPASQPGYPPPPGPAPQPGYPPQPGPDPQPGYQQRYQDQNGYPDQPRYPHQPGFQDHRGDNRSQAPPRKGRFRPRGNGGYR